MRELVGLLLFHAVLIGTGLTLLRAFGLLAPDARLAALAAAVGPALLTGIALVVPLLIVLLVLGIALNLFTATAACLGCAAVAELIVRRRSHVATDHSDAAQRSPTARWFVRVAVLAAGAFTLLAAVIFARLPTVWDDARIWSMRGLTLTYYHGLQPEIFQSQFQSGGHPVYPLLQPALEALLSQAMGGPQLRFLHAELLLVFAAAIWTAAYLIARSAGGAARNVPIWVAALALLFLTPAALYNVGQGYADITGSVLLAVGALALALWLELDQGGMLALAAVLLAAAASTKDEDLVAGVIVLVVAAAATLTRHRAPGFARRAGSLGVAALGFIVLVAPWRIWVAAHHLTDSVEPPLPHALAPGFVLGRTHQLSESATAMLTQTLSQWSWIAALFIAAVAIAIVTRTTRRVACFYVVSVAAIVVSLLWLYTTTRASLAFLLPTSMGRTVDVFMVLAAVATAQLIARLADVTDDRRSAPLPAHRAAPTRSAPTPNH